jgi:DNA-binding transcriptional MerR regulator
MPNESGYSIGELAAMAGVTPRTIRYYVSIGLLASPGPGPQSRYGDSHLTRLRLIRKLQREHLPLGEIAQRLDGLDEEAVEQALEAGEADDAPGSALDYIRRLRSETAAPAMELWRLMPSGPLMDRSAATVSAGSGPASKASVPEQTQRTQWERVPLSLNVELHIRRPLGRLEQKRVERLIRIGREILEEGDQP